MLKKMQTLFLLRHRKCRLEIPYCYRKTIENMTSNDVNYVLMSSTLQVFLEM